MTLQVGCTVPGAEIEVLSWRQHPQKCPFLIWISNTHEYVKEWIGAGRAQARRLPLLILGLLPVPEDVGGGSCIVWIIHAEKNVFLKF